MSSVFSIFTQSRSQEDVKKNVLKFSTQQENVRCQFQARTQSFWGVFREKSRVRGFLLNQAVMTTAQLHSTKPEIRFCAGSNPACSVSEIRDGEDL